MSIIKDTFFGGAEKDAAKAQQKGIERGMEATEQAIAQARGDISKLFPAAQQNAQQGFQGALDVFGQAIPAQANIFQQGNVAAQNQIAAGLPQMQNAILGSPVDYSQMQATQLAMPDLSFLQQQLPEYIDPYATQAPAQNVANQGFNFNGPFGTNFNVPSGGAGINTGGFDALMRIR